MPLKLSPISPKKSLNAAFLKVRPLRSEIDTFKANLIHLLDKVDESEREENQKTHVRDFLVNTYYKGKNEINTKGNIDLVIHTDNSNKSSVGVIVEAKRPSNKSEWITPDKPNGKAFQELVLYYLRERIVEQNIDIKHLVLTNIYEWYIIDASYFDKIFYQNKKLVKDYQAWRAGQKVTTDTALFYQDIARPFIDTLEEEIPCTYFDIRSYYKELRNTDTDDDIKLIELQKLLSEFHLLKVPFANDSNKLDKRFYSELLHIIGLIEVKEGSKKLIGRHKESDRMMGSILEDTILQLDDRDKLNRVKNVSQYGSTKDEKLFNIALELTITWVNRILFLKLLEGQLLSYHKRDKAYLFLNHQVIKEFDQLDALFFQVLAKKFEERNAHISARFDHVPYLNSSLFEPTELEHDTLFISNLSDDKTIPIHAQTVLKSQSGSKRDGNMSTLEYLFAFLDAYDFSGDGSKEIQEDNKTLINASVLGLIFEKINGYKDGSFFTPGFITMYMCRETIRRAVVQKFNETKGWNCETVDHLYEKIEDRNEANAIINSIKICDPAVGSGHFLVSALNEIIAVKSDLRVLQDLEGKRLKEYQVEVVNDELIIKDQDGDIFKYYPHNKESQRVQEALFHEKQNIIERCLFGVDINPNSVKICRLRLWIELLKNAYYKNQRELETLPNIDINIKCGNSLVSRFAIGEDIKDVLKNAKQWNIETYRMAVDGYRNAKTKDEKRELESLIDIIKNDFKSEVDKPFKKKISEARGKAEKYAIDITNLTAFGQKLDKTLIKNHEDAVTNLTKLEAERSDIIQNKIYENAFEWRFEFPEVLNDEGDFVGFDVLIGNPPYGVKLIDREKEYLKNRFTSTSGEVEIYTFFIELVMTDLLKRNGVFSFITTNTIYYLDKFAQIRKKAFLGNRVISLLELEKQVFADAPDIVPAIYVLQKNSSADNLIMLYKSTETKRVYDLVEFDGFKINSIEQNKFETKMDFVFSLSTNKAKENLLKLISQLEPIRKSFKVVYGIKTGNNFRFISNEIKGNENWKKCASSAKNIKKYTIDWQGDYLNVCNDLAGLNSINYEQPKILIQYIRKLSMPVRLVCALDLDGEYFPLNNFSFVISENGNSLKVLLGILNSKLMNWYFLNSFVDYNIKPKYIEQLPLPKHINSSNIENLVSEIISLKAKDKEIDTTDLEKQIDQLIYKLYELTEEEIKIVEGK